MLDQTSLDSLRQQQPDAFKNAKVGDYIIAYPDRIFVFDYGKDRVVSTAKVPNQ